MFFGDCKYPVEILSHKRHKRLPWQYWNCTFRAITLSIYEGVHDMVDCLLCSNI